MCAFSDKKKSIWPWTLVALVMIGTTAMLDKEAVNKNALSTQVAKKQEINRAYSPTIASLTHETNLSPNISLRKKLYGALGWPAFFIEDNHFTF
ncbi:MAG: hypothetical protein HQL71_03180 [Magnetococcales bacterium]|nr:hypothetical protein [Magnetococcales bacterium]